MAEYGLVVAKNLGHQSDRPAKTFGFKRWARDDGEQNAIIMIIHDDCQIISADRVGSRSYYLIKKNKKSAGKRKQITIQTGRKKSTPLYVLSSLYESRGFDTVFGTLLR